MLRFFTRSIKMHLLLLLIWAFMGMAAAQSSCDPLTQYEKNGQCCQKCGPGTSMTSNGNCKEPQCKECQDLEYQNSYTTDSKCKRQDYCDPNLNFQIDNPRSKTEESPCKCKLGFHCSSEICQTCVPHSKCEPGQGARSIGNHTHDTVCQKCPEGTFSANRSWDGVCNKWTECGNGYHIHQRGTDLSDNICQETSSHAVAIAVCLSFFLVLVVGLVVCLCRGPAKRKVKDCLEFCAGGQMEPLNDEVQPVMAKPNADHYVVPQMIQQPSIEESYSTMTPEENAEPSPETSMDLPLTDKGNYVMQENGKSEVLSRQESQTQTLSHPSSSLMSSDF